MGSVSDYGGNHYCENRSCKQSRRNCAIFKCLSCNRVNWIPFRVLWRAAKQRCHFCGGVLEETDTSLKSRIGLTKKQIQKKINTVEDERSHEVIAGKIYYSHPNECRVCHKRFRSSVALKLHYEDSHGIKDDQ